MHFRTRSLVSFFRNLREFLLVEGYVDVVTNIAGDRSLLALSSVQ